MVSSLHFLQTMGMKGDIMLTSSFRKLAKDLDPGYRIRHVTEQELMEDSQLHPKCLTLVQYHEVSSGIQLVNMLQQNPTKLFCTTMISTHGELKFVENGTIG